MRSIIACSATNAIAFYFSQLGAIAPAQARHIAPDQFLKSDRIIWLSGNIGMRSHLSQFSYPSHSFLFQHIFL